MSFVFTAVSRDADAACACAVANRHAGNGVGFPEAIPVRLCRDGLLPGGAYRIERGDAEIRVFGGDRIGLIHGAGRVLHRGRTVKSETCVPAKEFRGIYFATHFYNYYQTAPVEKIVDYIEELALWGCNVIAMWFDMHHFTGLDDPAAQELLMRLKTYTAAARGIGMKVMLLMLANEYYAGAPKELLAENSTDGTGYFTKMCGFYYTELCPAKAVSRKLLLSSHREVLEQFADVGLDYISFGPYDQGGCTCADCRPWGAKGYVDTALMLTEDAKKVFPAAGFILSTWRFDGFTHGEWDAFLDRFDEVADVFDCVTADPASGVIPDRLFTETARRGVRILGFPEISMEGATPWGGFGAVATPKRLHRVFPIMGDRQSGGYAYSEGIFEDLNKITVLSYDMGNSTPEDDARDYFRTYFSEAAAEKAVELVECLETDHYRYRLNADGTENDYPSDEYVEVLPRFVLRCTDKVDRAAELIRELEAILPERIRTSDRFRMLALRAEIDAELARTGGEMTARTEAAAEELERIFYADRADCCVSPITERAIRENRGHI